MAEPLEQEPWGLLGLVLSVVLMILPGSIDMVLVASKRDTPLMRNGIILTISLLVAFPLIVSCRRLSSQPEKWKGWPVAWAGTVILVVYVAFMGMMLFRVLGT